MGGLEEFLPAIAEMLQHPPDPNAPLPLANRHEVVYGVTIPFLILSWIAVGFRLHTRLRVVREPGIDDAFVVIAAFLNLAGHIAFYGGIKNGLGQHLVYLIANLAPTMIWFYIANGAYTTASVCIKLSLLFQYLRLFRDGYRRKVTLALLALVMLWGGVFIFMAWFPCFPVSGFWNRTMMPPAKCYGFGYDTVKEAKTTLFAFAGSNTSLDVVILLVPLTEYFRPGLKRKQIYAMTGLFALGSMVVLMAVLRLWSGIKNNTPSSVYNFTRWWPEVLIFSNLEIDFAIMCASMPIFWPSVLATWSHIFVTQEVTVTRDRRSHYTDERSDYLELQRTGSMKSHISTEGLTKSASREDKSWFSDFDRPKGSGVTQVEAQLGPQKARVL